MLRSRSAPCRWITLCLATAGLVCLTLPGLGADLRGPAIGAGMKYETAVRAVAGEVDTDHYVGALIAGESLTVTVTSTKRSDLLPTIALIGPDDLERAVEVKIRKKGRKASIKKFVLDATGFWAVRISGLEGTEGGYVVAFKVGKAKPLKFKKETLGGGSPSRDHLFGGIDGALLTLTLKGSKKGDPVALVGLLDPAGGDVASAPSKAVDDVVVKRTKTTLKKLPLGVGAGDYVARVETQGAAATYNLTLKVVPQGRLKSKKPVAVSPDEPFLAPTAAAVRVAAGQVVRLVGQNFAPDPVPTVLFGDVAGTAVVVTGSGTVIDVIVPDNAVGTLLDVTVISDEGQATTRVDHVFYAPPPTVEALIRVDGSPVVGGGTAGGQTLRITGTGLVDQDQVLFGTVPATAVTALSPSLLEFTSPAGTIGTVDVTVRDEFGRTAAPPIPFEYKVAPVLAADPLSPPGARPNVPTTVTVSGTGFSVDDVVSFDGAPVAAVFVSTVEFEFDVPAAAVGSFAVSVTDRVGTRVAAPDFLVKNPPSVTGLTVVGGPHAGGVQIALAGGSILRVAGANFDRRDLVTLGGGELTVSSVTGATFEVTTASHAAGMVDLVVRDVLGGVSTLRDAAHYVGYEDATSTLSPGAGTADDLSTFRGAVGDLDRDGVTDDLVLTSYDYSLGNVYPTFALYAGTYYSYRGTYYTQYGANTGPGVYNSPGTRTTYTRLLFGGGTGTLSDVTATNFPAAVVGGENWNGVAVAIGDLDAGANNGPEIILAGIRPGFSYLTMSDVRVLGNNGSGTFTYSATNSVPTRYTGAVVAYLDYYGTVRYATTYYPRYPRYALPVPTSLALGDLDGDLDLDLVVGRDDHDVTYRVFNPQYVDYVTFAVPTVSALYVYNQANYVNLYVNRYVYYSGTLVLDNQVSTGGGLVDVTGGGGLGPGRMPDVGNDGNRLPAFHARDVALGDLDGDTDLDLVVTWDDPTTVTSYGRYMGTGTDQARPATRILTNNGSGVFTDVTATWLPAAVSPEFWQAHRVVFTDLDGDGDADLVLVHRDGLDAFLGAPTHTRSALRVLRNDRPAATTFTDVTSTALPPLSLGSNDDFRGDELVVRDVNGDGDLDLLLGTSEALVDNSGTPLRSTRLFFGSTGLTFVRGDAFLPAPTADSGEADALLLGDLAGSPDPTLLLGVETAPVNAPGGETLRLLRWKK